MNGEAAGDGLEIDIVLEQNDRNAPEVAAHIAPSGVYSSCTTSIW